MDEIKLLVWASIYSDSTILSVFLSMLKRFYWQTGQMQLCLWSNSVLAVDITNESYDP